MSLKRIVENEIKKGPKAFFIDNQILLITLAIFAVAFFLRFFDLGLLPQGVSASEKETIITIESLSKKDMWLDSGYHNAAYIYLGYLWSKVFGLTVLSLRCLSALIGGLTVVLGYLFISKWFSKKVAIFTSLLFAVSSFHVAVSRLILPEIFLPFVLFALFLTLTYAYREKNIWLFGLSGFLTGVGFYCSPAFLLVPLIFIFAGGYFFKKNRKFILAYRQELLVAVLGFLAVIIPCAVSFYLNPDAYFDFLKLEPSLGSLVMNLSQIPSMLFLEGPRDPLYNLGTEPLLDPFIFVSSLGGLVFAAISISRRKYFFLILWMVFLSLYAALKPELEGVDLLGLLPVIYIFSALIIGYLLEKWFETFPADRGARLLAVGLMSVFFALSMLYNLEKYFVAYRHSEQVQEEFADDPPIPLK